MKKILLLVPPFFTPFAPPLGVSLLKKFLQEHDYYVRCKDLNTSAALWDMHHEYFEILDQVVGNHLDGYSLYWYILNPHMLAYANGATIEECNYVVKVLCEKYSLNVDNSTISTLTTVVKRYFILLEKIILQECQINQYDYVGTSTYSTSLASTVFIHKIVKMNYPSITTLMGGGVFADDLGLQTENLQTLIRDYPFIDKIIIGEGELLFLKTLQGEFKDQRVITLSDIDNEILDINKSLMPDFSDFDLDDYHHVTIEGSRSCPFQCQFCSERIQWGPYRKKNAEYLGEQLLSLYNTYGKKTFFLGDSLINLYVQDLSEYLVQKGPKIYFDGYLRAEKPVTIRENTRLWAQAGLYRVRLGMESASPQVLKLMNKKITPNNMCECLKSLSNAGIRTTTYWVVGFPGETEEDFQATLDFIKENHRHIYELEAHPYYYYPTSQGISSEYESQSLYPEKVGDIVNFKKYDIVNPIPSREERFNRLRRISDLSKELGLINIYTLQDIFKAEERWLSLYPAAREIYAGTRFKRNLLNIAEHNIDFLPEQLHLLGYNMQEKQECIIYQISIHKEVNEDILREAISELFQYHELLNVSFLKNQDQTKQIFDKKMNEFELDILNLEEANLERVDVEIDSFVQRMESKVHLEKAPLLKIGLIKLTQKQYKLILVGSRLICDPESMGILVEDIYRIYQQKLSQIPISLEPIKMSFSEFSKKMLYQQCTQNLNEVEQLESKNKVLLINLGVEFTSCLQELDFMVADLVTFVVMQSLREITEQKCVAIDISTNYRNDRDELKKLFGPLRRIFEFNYEYVDQEISVQTINRFKKLLKNKVDSKMNFVVNNEILLNFEYMYCNPWLGGDGWTQVGFSLNNKAITNKYSLEIIPRIGVNSLTIDLQYINESNIAQIADQLSNVFIEIFHEKVNDLETYIKSKRFWLTQFDNYQPKIILTENSVQGELIGQVGDLDELHHNLVNMAQSNHYNVEELYLSAFSLVVSKYFKVDDFAVLVVTADGFCPIRFRVNECCTFNNFVAETTQLLSGSRKHKYSLQILDEYYNSQLVTTIGYILNEEGRQIFECSKSENGKRLNLVLEMSSKDFRIEYMPGLFEENEIRNMCIYYENLLANIIDRDQQNIGEIEIAYKTSKHEESLNIDFDF